MSPDGHLLAVRGPVEDLHVIDLRTDTIVTTVESGERTASVTFSPDGRLLAVAMSYQGGASVEVHDVDEHGRLNPRYEIERAHYHFHPVPFIDTLDDVRFAPMGQHSLSGKPPRSEATHCQDDAETSRCSSATPVPFSGRPRSMVTSLETRTR